MVTALIGMYTTIFGRLVGNSCEYSLFVRGHAVPCCTLYKIISTIRFFNNLNNRLISDYPLTATDNPYAACLNYLPLLFGCLSAPGTVQNSTSVHPDIQWRSEFRLTIPLSGCSSIPRSAAEEETPCLGQGSTSHDLRPYSTMCVISHSQKVPPIKYRCQKRISLLIAAMTILLERSNATRRSITCDGVRILVRGKMNIGPNRLHALSFLGSTPTTL